MNLYNASHVVFIKSFTDLISKNDVTLMLPLLQSGLVLS